MKKIVYRAAAATVLGLSLTTGVVAADTNSGTINTTGPGSSNTVSATTTTTKAVNNNNNLGVQNHNWQGASSGEAEVKWNTTGGSATSGHASNANATVASATINNAPSGGAGGATTMNATGSISNTGPSSSNAVVSTQTSVTTVNNNNNLQICNTNMQEASTGDAEVKGNTTGGSATTGGATNTNTSTFSFNVTN